MGVGDVHRTCNSLDAGGLACSSAASVKWTQSAKLSSTRFGPPMEGSVILSQCDMSTRASASPRTTGATSRGQSARWSFVRRGHCSHRPLTARSCRNVQPLIVTSVRNLPWIRGCDSDEQSASITFCSTGERSHSADTASSERLSQ